ncbi:MAG: hypothetical protein ABIQ27_02890 [Flavobacterium sp.]|uniref:hypothetical protein n=1 Tax=Flavobacterium sp. TaxID=239 RepID=UPI003267B096
MIPEKIQALFDFIDYLDQRKSEFIDKYLPLCDELSKLDIQRSKLKPKGNYIDKQNYDEIQKTINEKFQPITQNIYIPVLNRLKELKIWSGDDVYTSIWNNNISAIYEFRENFETEDIPKVIAYKQKYLRFRKDTNSNFLCLQFVFSNLDEIFKDLFDFFKDTTENEFESFETKIVEVNSIADAVKGFVDNKGKNVKYSIPKQSLFDYQNVKQYLPQPPNIKNEIIMGHKIEVGDITGNSGQIIIGNEIKIFDSLNGKKETADKISDLIELIRQEQSVDTIQKQTLITNFDKVKEEVLEEKPDKSKIFKWLSATKGILENLVLTHHITEAVHWVYNNLNFLIH